MSDSKLEELYKSRPKLLPFLFFRNNALDIVKLAAHDDPDLALACRNLIFLAFEKWGWALLRNLERRE